MIASKLPATGASIFSVMTSLANQESAINLAQGFPDFDCDPVLQDLVYKYLRDKRNQYAPMPGNRALLEAIAEKLVYSYGEGIDPEANITVTAGATQAIYTAISSLIKPGDEVIIIEPVYDSYRPAIMVNGGVPVVYALSAPEFKYDWEEISRLVTGKTKMIIVNTPHNPSGTVFEESDLDALQKLAIAHDLIVVSDEVYEHIIFDGRSHQSVLRRKDLFERSLACFSFGKTFHITGWKVGYVVGGRRIMEEFRKLHQFTVFCVNHPVQCALAEYLQNGRPYDLLPVFFQKKRDLFYNGVSSSRFRFLHSKGSYFISADYSAVSDMKPMEFASWLTKERKLAAIPMHAFYSVENEQRLLRFCFAKTEEVLKRAIDIIIKI